MWVAQALLVQPRRLSLTDIHHTDRQSIWTDNSVHKGAHQYGISCEDEYSSLLLRVRRAVREEIHDPAAKPGEIQAKRILERGRCDADVETAFRHQGSDLHEQLMARGTHRDPQNPQIIANAHRRAATDIHMYGHGQEENNLRHESEGRVVSRRKVSGASEWVV